MPTVDQIINGLRDNLDAKTDTELARKLGINKSTISSWRTRDRVPERYKRILDGESHQTIAAAPLGWSDYEKAAFNLALFRTARLFGNLVANSDYRECLETFERGNLFWFLLDSAKKDIASFDENGARHPRTSFAIAVYDDLKAGDKALQRDYASWYQALPNRLDDRGRKG